MSSELIELGQRALTAVSSSVANGASLIKCKLLACEFYEALRHELQNTPVTHSKRAKLIAAENQCHRIAIANVAPDAMRGELKRAIELLEFESPPVEPSHELPRSRPMLRVIEGGLSRP